ncbi:MAG: B12-binding domain-containing radical SAM protein [Nitrospirae bacterium]|nr:B12-binding domain-containing radical SAM protein [Nitrospirota bacterium]MCL5976737.1 B12-binding domain-containing radical SAM protein [Nitrospirota bacterium]
MNKGTDICLVSPPNRSASATVPAALLYLHAWLTKSDIKTKIVDIKFGQPGINLTSEQIEFGKSRIIERIKELAPKFVGIPCYTSEFWDVIDLCSRIKQAHSCTIIVGGLHVSIKAEDFFFKGTPIDIAVEGDGQYPLVEIITRVNSGRSLEEIEGVIVTPREGDSIVRYGASSFKEWDAMPQPDYSQLNMDFYTKPHTGIIRNIIISGLHVFTTIGCPFSCTFCANSNRKVNFRPIEKVLDEIECLKNNYNIDSFYILDDTFLLKKERVREFVDGLKMRNLNMVWAMETRVNLIDEEMAKLISEGGCIQVDFGVESGSNEALRRMKKGITEDQIVKAFEVCRKYKLRTYANFMFNTPGETTEDVQKTTDMMRRTRPTRVAICLTVPFPGTAVYKDYVRPILSKEEYKIYNTPNLYFKVADPRFYMAEHHLDLTKLRINATARANKLRSIIDYTLNPLYWKIIVKSMRKTQYLKVLLSDFVALLISRIKNILKTYRF